MNPYSFWNKKIPTLLGLLVLIIGLGVTTYLAQQGVITIGRAGSSQTPENVRVSNITDTSFTVSFTTATSVTGSLAYGTNESLGSVTLDERDSQSQPESYTIHSILVKNLTPSTSYFFSILSGGTKFLDNNKPFQVQTGPTLSSKPQDNTLSGTIVLETGTTATDILVYLSSDSSQLLSTRLDNNGTYHFDVSTLRSNDLTNFSSLNKNTSFQLLAINNTASSKVLFQIPQNKIVPTITFSKNYDFTTSFLPLASSSAQPLFSNLFASLSAVEAPQVTTPKKDETFTDQQPLMKGVASPGASIKIIIHSDDNIQDQITADQKGAWTYRPSNKLSPGKHTITITTRDKNGILQTITRFFTVFAQGSQVDQSATPSATPTVIIVPTNTPIPTPTQQLLPPTPTVTFTPTPTPFLINTPTPTQKPIVAAPKPPGSSSAILLTLGALLVCATGSLLFFLSRGKSAL